MSTEKENLIGTDPKSVELKTINSDELVVSDPLMDQGKIGLNLYSVLT
jgi:hypothetical protein